MCESLLPACDVAQVRAETEALAKLHESYQLHGSYGTPVKVTLSANIIKLGSNYILESLNKYFKIEQQSVTRF